MLQVSNAELLFGTFKGEFIACHRRGVELVGVGEGERGSLLLTKAAAADSIHFELQKGGLGGEKISREIRFPSSPEQVSSSSFLEIDCRLPFGFQFCCEEEEEKKKSWMPFYSFSRRDSGCVS